MARPTKKALRLALTPLRKEAERYGLSLTTGGRPAPLPTPVQWEGFTFTVDYVRRPTVVCGVPFPYAVMWLHYRVKAADGTLASAGRTGAETVDWMFHPKGPLASRSAA